MPPYERERRLAARSTGKVLACSILEHCCTEETLLPCETRFHIEDPEELCILCGLCLRTCREIVGVSAISMSGRTPDKQVVTPFKEASEACIGCGSCAFICPTNVIRYTEKDGVRTIWGRDFELQACTVCGNYIEPKAQLEHWAEITGDPVETFFVCRDCR